MYKRVLRFIIFLMFIQAETTFKPDTEICCGEQVYDRADVKRICCGDDSESKQGVIHSVSNMQKPECCGNQVYSSLEKSCLDGVLLDRKLKRIPQDLKFMKTMEETGKSLLQELKRYINLSTAEAHLRNKNTKD
ncbi:uncharacterized protein LOC134258573 [Saccostrea cucullata]|uniref:uncharacterized protein LOC134258573 n=1 Tax=Saccostrea cuccullata TaxID=36930 RepID=UPI002ED0EE69